MQGRSMAVRTKCAAQEFAHHRDRAGWFQQELGQESRLVDAPADMDPLERQHAPGELERQHDGPFAWIVSGGFRPFGGEQLDIAQNRFAVERLPHVHPRLPLATDRPIAQVNGRRRRANARVQRRSLSLAMVRPGSRLQLVAGLILTRIIERSLRPYQDAILVQHELVGPNPASIGTQHAMIGREREGAAVLRAPAMTQSRSP